MAKKVDVGAGSGHLLGLCRSLAVLPCARAWCLTGRSLIKACCGGNFLENACPREEWGFELQSEASPLLLGAPGPGLESALFKVGVCAEAELRFSLKEKAEGVDGSGRLC